jgi:hypothetical protein
MYAAAMTLAAARHEKAIQKLRVPSDLEDTIRTTEAAQ